MKKEEIAQMIDHTLLKPAKKKEIKQLCSEAAENNFASVCIQPDYVKYAAQLLKDTDVKVCTVVGFPLGENTPATKAYETGNAVKHGAREIDMVINQSWAKGDEWGKVEKEIAAVVSAAGGNLVKVILETCNLDSEKIVKACNAAAEAGADYVKTSTGFGSGGAKEDDVKLMYETVKDAGLKVKASGGVRTYDDAVKMINAGASRIGTSNGVAILEGAE